MTRKMMFACMFSFALGCCCTAVVMMTCCWPATTGTMTSATETTNVGTTQTAWQPSLGTSTWGDRPTANTTLASWETTQTVTVGQTETFRVLPSTTQLPATSWLWDRSTTPATQWGSLSTEQTFPVARKTTKVATDTAFGWTPTTPTNETTPQEWTLPTLTQWSA